MQSRKLFCPWAVPKEAFVAGVSSDALDGPLKPLHLRLFQKTSSSVHIPPLAVSLFSPFVLFFFVFAIPP